MKYLFILGRNPWLSVAEIISYFEKQGNKILNYFQNKNSLLIEAENPVGRREISKFGGVIAIGDVIASGNLNEVLIQLEKQEIYFGEKNKFNYLILNLSDDKSVTELSNFLKKKFRKEKLKATEKKPGGMIKLQTGETMRGFSSGGLIDERYFLFNEGHQGSPYTNPSFKNGSGLIEHQGSPYTNPSFKNGSGLIEHQGSPYTNPSFPSLKREFPVCHYKRQHNIKSKETFYFGKIIEVCNYTDIEKRDMKKPFRREELSISPRLAKIMINLSQVKKGERLLDPFCGVGVILQEALIQNIKSIGIDKDENAVNGALKNLEWLKIPKENYKLITGDSGKINIEKSDVVVTEPHFGEILRNIPSKEKTRKIISKFEDLIIKVMRNLKNSVKGRIVFTAPSIRISRSWRKRVSCDINNILRKTGLKLAETDGVKFPISEFREGQIVGREIFVLEKV